METNQKPWKTMKPPWKSWKPSKTIKPPWKTMETNQKPWKTMKPPWKTMVTNQKPWKTMKQPWKIMETNQKPWKTTLNFKNRGNQQVLIFRYKQTDRHTLHHNIYITIAWSNMRDTSFWRKKAISFSGKFSQFIVQFKSDENSILSLLFLSGM